MKNIIVILLSFYTVFTSAQQDKAHQNLIMRERSQALSKMLQPNRLPTLATTMLNFTGWYCLLLLLHNICRVK